MNCDTYHELIVADLDGTLSASERDAVRAHLDTCTACRNARALEAEFAAYLRRGARIVETPHLVRERLLAALASAGAAVDTSARHRTMPATFALGAALVLGITMLLALVRPTVTDFVEPVTDDYLAAAAAALPLDVETDDPAALARYYDGSHRFDFPAVVMDLAPQGYRLLGGAIRQRRGVVYAVTVYDHEGDKVLCHRFREHGLVRSGPVALRSYVRARDLSLRVTRSDGLVCCLSSRMSPDEFERTVLAAAE